MGDAAFQRGDPVVLRSIHEFGDRGRRVAFAVAGFVIVDDADLTVVCTTPGSTMAHRAGPGSGPNGRLVRAADWDGTYEQRPWSGSAVTRVHRPGESWSVWRWHDGTDWFDTWYGNLVAPWRRTQIGFDSQDWALDVVAEGVPGSDDFEVRYKDEDELAFFVEIGEATPAEATQIREAGERLTARALAARWPFDADWSAWVPDPAWGRAALPESALVL